MAKRQIYRFTKDGDEIFAAKHSFWKLDQEGFTLDEKWHDPEFPIHTKETRNEEVQLQEKEVDVPQKTEVTKEAIREFILGMDPEDDSQWIGSGKPSMSVLEAEFGAALSRKQVDAFAEDLDRDAVAAQ